MGKLIRKLAFDCTPEMELALRQLAEADDRKTPAYIRKILQDHIDKVLPPELDLQQESPSPIVHFPRERIAGR